MKTSSTSESHFQKAVVQSLLELKKQDPKCFAELISLPPFIDLQPVEKIEWLGNEKSLRAFFDLLRNKKMISCEWDFLQNLFIGQIPIKQKVKWESDINELLYLFDCLRDEKIIFNHPAPHKQLQKYFLNKFGKLLNNKSMASSLEKGVRRNERVEIIEEIIEAVLKANQSS